MQNNTPIALQGNYGAQEKAPHDLKQAKGFYHWVVSVFVLCSHLCDALPAEHHLVGDVCQAAAAHL
jgi:hypothetical protein